MVFGHELKGMWLSPKGLAVLFAYTVLLSVMAYAAATDADLNLLDARESVGVVVRSVIGLGTLVALVVSADAIAGERERDTLEALLVTAVPRRNLVIGKLLAASTMWMAAIILALPYVFVMANGPGVTLDAVLVLVAVGSLVGAALTAFGMAVSALAFSNRVSLAAAFGTLLVLAAPSQLPAITAKGVVGALLIKINPFSAGLVLAGRILIDHKSWSSQWTLLIAPVVAAITLTIVAVALSRRLKLGGVR